MKFSSVRSTLLSALFFLGAVASISSFVSAHEEAPQGDVVVATRPVIFDLSEPAETLFGELEWRGGIEIRSPNGDLGGISGLIIRDNGTSLLGILDVGSWLTADLTYRTGILNGLENASLTPLLGAPGEKLFGKDATDSEGLGLANNGDILVSFERDHRIARYDFRESGAQARATYIAIPEESKNFTDNKGLESIGQFPTETPLGDKILTIAERYLDGDGNHTGWLIAEGDPVKLQFARVEDFDITALTILPDGRLILLERAFSLLFGPAMRLRLIEQSELRADQIIIGRELMRADTLKTIDNMEGLANHVSADGETILTLVSDNNFRSFQRTLLMQFALR
jgi:hypothetical protein